MSGGHLQGKQVQIVSFSFYVPSPSLFVFQLKPHWLFYTTCPSPPRGTVLCPSVFIKTLQVLVPLLLLLHSTPHSSTGRCADVEFSTLPGALKLLLFYLFTWAPLWSSWLLENLEIKQIHVRACPTETPIDWPFRNTMTQGIMRGTSRKVTPRSLEKVKQATCASPFDSAFHSFISGIIHSKTLLKLFQQSRLLVQ